MSYLDQLNDVQKAAVQATEGPVMVIAGPGSGKTRVLTYRIAHLIQQGVPPWEILALTFTNKAAREMRERIEQVVGDRAYRVWAGTFHSLFARILRIEAEHIGYPSNFTIYDTDDTKSVLSAIVKEMNLNKEAYGINSLRSRISSAKSNLIPPKAYRQDRELMEQDRVANRSRFIEVYEKYMARNKRSGAMDFDDLLYRLYELWQKHPDVLEKYRQRFRYVLVDEFQDTNYLQYAIIKKLVKFEGSPENICIVGDDAQSIYAFRGATIENILSFEKDFSKAQIYKLEQNYRSTNYIIQAANQVIQNNKRQIPKKIWSDKGSGQKIQVIRAMTDNEEGRRIADTILEQKNRHHLRNQDIAILYRTNAQSRIFEEQLRRYNIPYRVFGGLSFYQRKEIKDMIAYLRLAVNPRDEEALRRVINYPKRGIGQSTVAKISEAAAQTNQPMWECLNLAQVPTRTTGKLQKFEKMAKSFQQKAREHDAFVTARYIAEESGLMKELKKDNSIEGLGRLENLNALLDGIQEFVEDDVVEDGSIATDKSLAAYLQGIALMTDLDQDDEQSDFVTLMSAHSAKGLEFPSVFLVGLEEKLFPSWMSLDSPEGVDEERRLFYVAITRAERFLTLSYANSRYKFGKMVYNQPSRFLDEVAGEHLDGALPRRRQSAESGESRSGVRGNFKPLRSRKAAPAVDLKDFQASPSSDIQAGMKVLHPKFGEGKVLSIDGENQSRIATIFFPDLGDDSEKRIMLRFAKLQILT